MHCGYFRQAENTHPSKHPGQWNSLLAAFSDITFFSHVGILSWLWEAAIVMKRSPVDGKPCGEHDGNMTLLVPSCTHVRKVSRFRHEFRLLCYVHCTSHFDTVTFTQHSLISHLLILLSYRKKKKQSLVMSSVKKLLCFCFTDQMSVKQHAVHPVVFLHLNEPRGTSFLTFLLLYVHVDVISFLKLNTLWRVPVLTNKYLEFRKYTLFCCLMLITAQLWTYIGDYC